MQSFLEIAINDPFPLENLPYGIFSTSNKVRNNAMAKDVVNHPVRIFFL